MSIPRRQGFFAVSRNPLVWTFFAIGVAGFIGWVTVGGLIFLLPTAIGIIGGSLIKSRDETN